MVNRLLAPIIATLSLLMTSTESGATNSLAEQEALKREHVNMINTTLIPIRHREHWEELRKKIRVPGNIYSELTDLNTLYDINKWVNERIEYVREDVDYWKSPEESINDGHGDCEDQAILKMAILVEKGYSPDDVYLVTGYDQINRNDHAIVVVREGSSYKILDNHKNTIFEDKDYASFFKPMISYTLNKTFIHGRRV